MPRNDDIDDEIIENDDDLIEDDDSDDEQAPPTDPAIEAKARKLGWRPESEWDDERAEREGRRKPTTWLTAEEFIANTEDSVPMMRSQLDRMMQRVEQSDAKLSEMHGIFKEQRRMASDSARRAYERGVQEAKAAMRQAAEEGDVEGFDKAQSKLEEMTAQPERDAEQEPQQQQAQTQAQIDAATQRWLQKNPWFLQDSDLNQAMKDQHRIVLAASPHLEQFESLIEAADAIKARFPERFESRPSPGKKPQAAVNAPTGRSIGSQQKGKYRLSDIPREDQAVFKKNQKMFKDMGEDYTEQEFLAEYYGES